SQQVIYLGDIDFDAPGEATATDILVRQHRTRVRVKRVKDKGTTRKKRRTKPKRRIRSGKPLHPEEDEVEYILTIGMMLGLRVAVGRQANPLAKPELTVEDFYQARFFLVDKYTFPPSGATGYLVTPSHKLGRTFKFKDYAPKVFKKIREHFGVDKVWGAGGAVAVGSVVVDDAAASVVVTGDADAVLSFRPTLPAPGVCMHVRCVCFPFRLSSPRKKRKKSAQHVPDVCIDGGVCVCFVPLGFGHARQMRYMLSVAVHLPPHPLPAERRFCHQSSETKFLRRILPHYYEHVKVHPETFLVRFYGMYRVKMHHLNKKVHFIVMNSVLDTYKEIHNTYDLKGSSLGRDAKPGEKVLKDNDLAERQGKLHLGSQREVFLKASK
ncbi:unnamed protein product, partial [Ectocarpus fasciculatus]